MSVAPKAAPAARPGAVGWPYAVLAVLAGLVALASYRFLALGLGPSFPDMGGLIAGRPLAFVAHVSASPVALVAGLLQIHPRLRAARPRLHRALGYIYAASVALGAVSGFAIAMKATGGPVATVGFAALAVLWLGATGLAVAHARAGRIALHRAWMIRSYALTLAAVTLRLFLPGLLFGVGLSYPDASVFLAWLCWVPNVILAELYLRRSAMA